MNNPILVRLATPEDAESLAKLNYEFNGVLMDMHTIQETLVSSNELVALGIRGDTPVGFACGQYFKSVCYRELYGEITEMYVSENARRSGCATSLLSFLEAELRARGVKDVKIITGANNEAAIATYTKNDYTRQEHVVLSKKL
ncbi:GNAT family N-acetyltransferase [Paenibacillus sp. P46E]|uniref:GNAT family N-acetyltransferase n=1 Tax=Paenibacillus sp. P46E TaxID=1349436 RepID=UPI00093ABAEE|nr:GNAT family N-acetyltransferase [Paenibacillus sp. P46E]OKP99797.1 GCN5 family acetyltransferase [Paenibacillus sp. P46E]